MESESAMEAGTILSMGPQQPANPHAHPASRTKLQHAAETADGPGLASAATWSGGSSVCVQGGGGSGYCKWTGRSSTPRTEYAPAYPLLVDTCGSRYRG